MEIKMKYQYTYFIYPYVVKENNYEKYLSKLFHDKNCKLKTLEKDQNLDLYTYFLPKIRNYMFWTLEFSGIKMKKLNEFDNSMKATIVSKYPCTIFEYKIDKDIQGKTTDKEGIFFNIRNIDIICFNTGICFLVMKTTLDEGSSLSDLCNFNYKFRDIYSSANRLKDFENIKIQTDTFKDIKSITSLIKELTGKNDGAKELNIDIDRFITYSYACIGQEDWNENTNQELLSKEFYKLVNVEPANFNVNCETVEDMNASKFIKHGCTTVGNMLLTSDINTENYTKVPNKYENEFLYNYIFVLYKKLYLNKLNEEFKVIKKFNNVRKEFTKFTQELWIEDITNDEQGKKLTEKWNKILNIDKLFTDTKQKYYVMYKNINVEKIAKSNKGIVCFLAILIIINIINCITLLFR